MKAECGVYLQLDLRWKKHAQQAQKLQEQPGTTGQGCLALQIETHLLSTTIKDPGLQRCMAPEVAFDFGVMRRNITRAVVLAEKSVECCC